MGLTESQPPPILTKTDIKSISEKVRLDYESVAIWYEKLQAACPSGKITKSDAFMFLRRIDRIKEDRISTQADSIYNAFDLNDDGVVDLREFFIGFAAIASGDFYETMKYVFSTYDQDKNSIIDKKETDQMYKILEIHTKGDPNKRNRLKKEWSRFMEHFTHDIYEDEIKISQDQFISYLADNERLCELLSPFILRKSRGDVPTSKINETNPLTETQMLPSNQRSS